MKRIVATAALALLATGASAQSTADEIEKYRQMLADGNPAELWEMKGQELWTTKRGPKAASLEQCDLGQGPGVVKGAFVTLPRYFEDTGKVQDLESRLLTCMETLQGFDAAEIAKTGFGRGEQKNLESLVAYISAESRDMPFDVPQGHPKEREMYEVGKRAFFLRAGPFDFSCASCHASDNLRIRMQDLPNLTQNKGAGVGFGAWPAYRVSNGQLWGMQRRINDCFRQQRMPYPEFASDVTVALSVYMGVTGKGVESKAPALKR